MNTIRGSRASLAAVAAVPGQRLGVPALQHFVASDQPFEVFPESKASTATIGSLLLPGDTTVVKKGPLDTPAVVVDLDHVGPWGMVEHPNPSDALGSNRFLFGNANVLTAKLRPYLGKTFTNSDPELLGSTEWIPLRVDAERLRPQLLAYMLQSSAFRRIATVFMSGKEHPRIGPEVLKRLRVPILAPDAQDELIGRLAELDKEAKDLLARLSKAPGVVSAAFEEHFGLQRRALEDARTQTRTMIGLTDVAGNRDARFSFRYHSPSTRHALAAIQSLPHVKLGELVSAPIELGAGVSPDNYVDEGTTYYVSMATIKTWRFDEAAANRISEDYFKANEARTVRKGDIIMARSGEGTIGKAALILEDIRGVHADFTMRIRLDPTRCDRRFVFHFIMSAYFQELVYGEKKGLGNNTNIFPVQLRELPVLMPDPDVQRSVADEISHRLQGFEDDRTKLTALRQEMDNVLTETLRSPSQAAP